MRHLYLSAALTGALLVGPVVADEPVKEPESVQKARVKLDARLKKINAQDPQVVWINEPELAKIFPNDLFFGVRFRQFPVAIAPPQGLKAGNVFAVSEEAVQRIRDHEDLEDFFQLRKRGQISLELAKDLAACWLALAPEYAQDGYYKFEIQRKTFAPVVKEESPKPVDSIVGQATVIVGGSGYVEVKIDFESRIPKITHAEKIQRGTRPRCHATLLLDPNPLVRRICEEDLLVMGLAARDYLREQRARAAPDLQREIDRVWRQMQKNGW